MRRNEKIYVDVSKMELESKAGRNLIIPNAGKVSGQRKTLLQAQFPSSIPPLHAESPLTRSSFSDALLVHSSCIEKLRGTITLLKKFVYQDTVYYFYLHNNVVHLYIDDRYTENVGFACQKRTDLERLEEGVETDISDEEENFTLRYIQQYDPVSDTVKYGRNGLAMCTTTKNVAQDSFEVSKRFAESFGILKTSTIKLDLTHKSIVSKYPNIFPKLGEFVEDPILFKIVGDDKGVSSIAQDPEIPNGYEDESITLDMYTYINKIEVYCNNPIKDETLEELRLSMLMFRSNVKNFIDSISDKYELSNTVKVYQKNFSYNKFRNGTSEIKYPYIILHTKTISVAEIETKLTNMNGGKVTITHIFPNKTYMTKYGEVIDIIYPANALINRSIAGVLYEIFLNAIGRYINRAVRNGHFTSDTLYEFLDKMYECIGQRELFRNSKMNKDEYLEFLKTNRMEWFIDPYDVKINVEDSMNKLEALAAREVGFEKDLVYRDGREVSSRHVVGYMFMLRLLQDRQHAVTGVGNPEIDSKGNLVDNSTDKKTGKAIYAVKPLKISVLVMKKLLSYASNPACAELLNTENKLHGTKDVSIASGFDFRFTESVTDGVISEDDDYE